MGFLGDLLGFGTSIGSIAQQNQIAKDNLEFQKEAQKWNQDSWRENFDYQKMVTERSFDYNKELQEKIFGREDNAVQRRVEDLINAGLSPTLAAGSAASAGATVGVPSSSATQAGHISAVQKDASYAQQLAHLTDGIQGVVSALSDIEDYKAKAHNLAYAESHDLPYGSEPTMASTLYGAIDRFINGLGLANNLPDFAQKGGSFVNNVFRFLGNVGIDGARAVGTGVNTAGSVASQVVADVSDKVASALDGIISYNPKHMRVYPQSLKLAGSPNGLRYVTAGLEKGYGYQEGEYGSRRGYEKFKDSQLERYFR